MIKVYQWLQLPSKVTKKEENDSKNENIESAKSTIWNMKFAKINYTTRLYQHESIRWTTKASKMKAREHQEDVLSKQLQISSYGKWKPEILHEEKRQALQ